MDLKKNSVFEQEDKQAGGINSSHAYDHLWAWSEQVTGENGENII